MIAVRMHANISFVDYPDLVAVTFSSSFFRLYTCGPWERMERWQSLLRPAPPVGTIRPLTTRGYCLGYSCCGSLREQR